MAEGRRRHAIGLHTRATSGRLIVAPSLKQLRLDETQCGAHRLVVRTHHSRSGAAVSFGFFALGALL